MNKILFETYDIIDEVDVIKTQFVKNECEF